MLKRRGIWRMYSSEAFFPRSAEAVSMRSSPAGAPLLPSSLELLRNVSNMLDAAWVAFRGDLEDLEGESRSSIWLAAEGRSRRTREVACR